MSDNFWNDVKKIFDAYNVPAWVWYPLAWAESRGNPNAIGDNGCSVGLFQLNRCVGQGTGYTVEQLKDPLFNAQIAAQRIGAAWQQLQSSALPPPELALQVARQSGHPLTGDFASMVTQFLGAGEKIGTALSGNASGIFLSGVPSAQAGNPPSLDDIWNALTNFFADPVNALLLVSGAVMVFLVIVAFIFQNETVQKLVMTSGKVAATAAV
jgi:hypothetical protein